MEQPSYFRARNAAFWQFIKHSDGNTDKNSPFELLKYGVVHTNIDNRFRIHVKNILKTEDFSNAPLSFTEICSFNTWFAMHPEKIAGTEYITTSREFPIGIRGSKEDIIKTISITDNEKRIRIAKAKALAKLKILKLLQL